MRTSPNPSQVKFIDFLYKLKRKDSSLKKFCSVHTRSIKISNSVVEQLK